MPEGELRLQYAAKTILLKTTKVHLFLDRGDIVCPKVVFSEFKGPGSEKFLCLLWFPIIQQNDSLREAGFCFCCEVVLEKRSIVQDKTVPLGPGQTPYDTTFVADKSWAKTSCLLIFFFVLKFCRSFLFLLMSDIL
jgi:hypothetical protein